MISCDGAENENPYQRKGIGSRMVKALIDWAKANSWERIEANSFEDLPIVSTGSLGASMAHLFLDVTLRASSFLCGILFALVLIQLPAAKPASAQSQDWPRPARQVLERFVGTWKTEVRIHYADPPARDFKASGKAEGREILDGRYVEFRSRTLDGRNSDLQIMTYDPKSASYRQWVFDADGYHHEATGHWDAASSTLTWKGEKGDALFSITDHWTSANRLEWRLVREVNGRRVQTVEGVVTRVSKPDQ